MLLDVEDDIEIAVSAAIGSGLTFAGYTEARAGIHAGRDAQLDGLLALNAALTTAIGATFTDDLAGALTSGASAGNREESLLVSKLSAAAASLTGNNAGALFCAGAIAGFAKFLARKLNFGVDARGSLFERERHVIAEISAALIAPAAATPRGEKILEAEEVAENVVKVAEDGAVEVHAAAGAGETSVAVGVIDLALLLIAEDAVG